MDKTARLHFECSRGIVAVEPLPYLGGAKKWYGERKAFFFPFPISRVLSSSFCGTGISKQFVVVVRLFFRSRVMTMVRPHATAPPKKTLLPFVGTGRPDLRLWGKWEEEEEEAHHYIQPGISQILIFFPSLLQRRRELEKPFFYFYLLVFSISDSPRRQKRRPWLSTVIGFFDKWAAMAIGAGFDHFLHICGYRPKGTQVKQSLAKQKKGLNFLVVANL